MEAFHTLAEISVAIAGFSSLVIVFRGRIADWQGQDFISLAFALSWSIGAVFFSLFPIVVGEFGYRLIEIARVGLFLLAAYMIFAGAFLQYSRRRLQPVEGAASPLSPSLSILYGVIVVGAISAGLGLFPGAVNGWYAAAITLLLAHATGELVLLVINAVRR